MDEVKAQKESNKKLITQIIAIILFLLILVLLVITVTSTAKVSNLAFGKYRFYIMKSESQPQIAQVGDLVITKKMKFGEIQENDSIVYKDGKFYYCDEIVETKKNNSIAKIIIAEKGGVKYQFSEDDIEGKVIHTIPTLGNIISFLRTPLGIVIFILFTLCIFAFLRVLLINIRE